MRSLDDALRSTAISHSNYGKRRRCREGLVVHSFPRGYPALTQCRVRLATCPVEQGVLAGLVRRASVGSQVQKRRRAVERSMGRRSFPEPGKARQGSRCCCLRPSRHRTRSRQVTVDHQFPVLGSMKPNSFLCQRPIPSARTDPMETAALRDKTYAKATLAFPVAVNKRLEGVPNIESRKVTMNVRSHFREITEPAQALNSAVFASAWPHLF